MRINPSTYVLKDGFTPFPVVWSASACVEPERLVRPDDSSLVERFGPSRGKRLMTWGRSDEDRNGPHWIGVRSGTDLHTDPAYPRYSHQIVLRSDGWSLGGLNDERLALTPATAFCLDTHSPHVLTRNASFDDRGLWYVAASFDAAAVESHESAVPRLIAFLKREGVVPC